MNPIFVQQFTEAVTSDLQWWDNATAKQRVKRLQSDLVKERNRLRKLKHELQTCDNYWKTSTLYAIESSKEETKSLLERIKYYRNGGETLANIIKQSRKEI